MTTAASAVLAAGIKSIQRGVITISSTSATATITAVNTGKSKLAMLGFSTSSNDVTASPRIVLTNSTTITANNQGISIGCTVSWELYEYNN